MWGIRDGIRFQYSMYLAYKKIPLGPQNASIKCAMATSNHPSDLVHRIAYPSLGRPGLRTDWRLPALAEDEEKQLPLCSNLRGKEISDIFYLTEPRPRNPWSAIGALAILSVLLLALVVVPLLRTDPLPKRETLTMLYLQPPSGAGSNVTKFQAPKLAPRYNPTSTGVRAPVNKTQEAPPPLVGTTGGVAGGVPGGVLSEMLKSAPSVPVLAKSSVPAPVKRIRIGSRVAEANLIHDVAPQYPPEAGRARIEGTVVLMAVIGKDGTVKDVRIENGLPILAQAAIDAVKQWRYRPYMIDGEPVEVDSRITINFTLSTS